MLRCRVDRGRLRDALPTITLAHVETGERPDRRIVHPLEPSRAIQPRQHVPRCQLTPAHSGIAIEGEQTRRRAALHDFPKRRFVLFTRLFAVGPADPPIHAPAAADRAVFAEQILKGRPKIWREWPGRELHSVSHRAVQPETVAWLP